MERKELEDRLDKFKKEILAEYDERNVVAPAEEARRKMVARAEHGYSDFIEDYQWMFREGVRWFRRELKSPNVVWSDYQLLAIMNIENRGTQ